MKKLLITGASGFLGRYLCTAAAQLQQWQVYGVGHSQAIALPGIHSLQLDLTDEAAVGDLFQTLKPDAVIHAAALSSPNVCQENPEAAYRINVLASWQLAELCGAANIPLVFTSSEQVFDGLNPPYREADPVCPVNLYGEQKVAAEVGILARHPGAVACRMPLMYGDRGSFIQPFIEKLRSGQVLNLFVDEIRNPVSGRSAAAGLLLALDLLVLEQGVRGYLHLGGRERLSRYEMGMLLVEILQLENVQINACRQADVQMAAPRPPDSSLESSLAFGLGYAPGTMREELAKILR
jgi:dTDP-4-dehydrorhamnose reductase